MRDALSEWLWRAEAKSPLACDATVAAVLAALCYGLAGDGALDPVSRAVLGAAITFLAVPSLRAAKATVAAGHDVAVGLYAWTAHFAAYFTCIQLLVVNEAVSIPGLALQLAAGAAAGAAIAYLDWRNPDRASAVPHRVFPMPLWVQGLILVWPAVWIGVGMASARAGEDVAVLIWELALLSAVVRTAEPEDWRHGLSYLAGAVLLIASIWLTR